nr:MAG TPA: hypothetical protein [Caudoviricetes sp.]
MRDKIINSLKRAFQSARIARISPTGIIVTRFIVSIMITPIILLSITYLLSFLQGYVSEEHGRLITVGSGIVDHVFTPPVLVAFSGFLALFVDRNRNGIPDRLEEQQRPSVPTNERGEGRK